MHPERNVVLANPSVCPSVALRFCIYGNTRNVKLFTVCRFDLGRRDVRGQFLRRISIIRHGNTGGISMFLGVSNAPSQRAGPKRPENFWDPYIRINV